MEKPEVYKVDPRSIHIDQRKQDSRRDAWDRDYMPANWKKPDKKTDKRIENAYNALQWCHYSKSEWGITYWTTVVNALVRKLQRESIN